MKLVVALLALLMPGAAMAAKAECNTFVHETNPDVTITDDTNSVTLKDGDETYTFLVTISKFWGQLTAVAYDGEGINGAEYPYRYLKLEGKQVLIFNSAVFYPTCK